MITAAQAVSIISTPPLAFGAAGAVMGGSLSRKGDRLISAVVWGSFFGGCGAVLTAYGSIAAAGYFISGILAYRHADLLASGADLLLQQIETVFDQFASYIL